MPSLTIDSADAARRRPVTWRYRFAGCLLITLTSLTAFGDDGQAAADSARSSAKLQTVSGGFLLVNGTYVAPPYTIKTVDKAVAVNGHQITPAQTTNTFNSSRGGRWAGPGGWGGRPRSTRDFGGRPPGRGSGRRVSFQSPQADLKRVYELDLEYNRLLIAFDNQHPSPFELPVSAFILTTLVSDDSADEKLAKLDDAQLIGAINTQQWEQVIANFEPTTELRERIEVLQEQEVEFRKVNREASESAQWYSLLASPSSKYGITLVAMVLAVVATGNLLLYRPEGHGRWSEKNDSSNDGLNMRRIVVILALLCGFDLLLTLAAQKAGGFLELNPLGSELISNPLQLAAFKLISLACACGILLKLKEYRGAQIASWWLCMVCTLLTFRWVTFNSLFFS